MKKKFSILLRASISLFLLVFLFTKIDLKTTLKVILTADPFYLLLSAFIFLIVYILAFLRWRMLLATQDIDLPLRRIISSYCGGLFFSLFLPSTIGGDIARSLDLGLYTQRSSVIVATVFLDRLSGFLGLVFVAITALIIGHSLIDEAVVYFTIGVLAVLLGVIIYLIFSKKLHNRINNSNIKRGGIKDKLKRLHTDIYSFRFRPFILILNLGYSIIIQGCSSLVAYYILRSLAVDINILYPMALNPVISAITTLPISIGGLGLREWSSVIFYRKFGVAQEVASAQSLVNLAFIVIFGLIGGIAYVNTFHNRRPQSSQSDQHSK